MTSGLAHLASCFVVLTAALTVEPAAAQVGEVGEATEATTDDGAGDESALARAHRAYDAADFASALVALDAVTRSDELDRSALIDYLELRALVSFATDDQTRMRAALEQLASVEPTHALASSVAPPVAEAFAEIRADRVPLSILTEATPEPGVLHLAAGVRGDPGRLVSRLVLHVREVGSPWALLEGDSGDVTLPEGGEVELFAEGLGMGGAVLARAGSIDAPRRATVPPLHVPSDDTGLHWGLGVGVGGAIALILGIVVGVVVTSSIDVTTVHVRVPGL